MSIITENVLCYFLSRETDEKDDHMNLCPHDLHCPLGNQSLQKLLYHASLNLGVLEIVSMWDEGQGWTSGQAASV